MTIALPRKLATTMGTELTFMPQIYEDMFHNTNGEVNMADGMDTHSGVRNSLASILEKYLRKRAVEYYRCGTDPGVVEVSTKPYKTANALKKNIRAIRRHAMAVMLTPTAEYSIGGGAHIHTGIMGGDDTERRNYCALMTLWGYSNPWMAWAFAGPKDSNNANALTEYRGAVKAEKDINYLCSRYEEQTQEYNYERNHLLSLTNTLHTVKGWNDSRGYRRDEVNTRRCWMMRHKKEMNTLANMMLKWGEENMAEVQEPQIEEVQLGQVLALVHKNKFIRITAYGEHGTIEFRCFLMQPTHRGHDKHIMLADAICRHVYKWMKRVGKGTSVIAPTPLNFANMKYSEAKRGFNAMLTELGLDPRDFRAECVNIALRLRARRGQGYI